MFKEHSYRLMLDVQNSVDAVVLVLSLLSGPLVVCRSICLSGWLVGWNNHTGSGSHVESGRVALDRSRGWVCAPRGRDEQFGGNSALETLLTLIH